MTCRVSSLNSKCNDNAYDMAPRKPKQEKQKKLPKLITFSYLIWNLVHARKTRHAFP